MATTTSTSTTTTTPAATSAPVASTATSTTTATTTSWFKLHERLLITLMVIGLGVFGFQKYADIRALETSAKVQQAQAQLVAQKNADSQLAAQVQQTTQQYQAMVQALSSQNSQLAASITARNVVLTQQQTVDKTLPLPQLDTRWAALADFSLDNLQTTNTGVVASQDAVIATVQQLENIPVLQANLKDVQTQAANTQSELNTANTLIGKQVADISGLNTQLVDQSKTCKDEIASVNAKARKSKLKLFGLGFVTGFVAGHIW